MANKLAEIVNLPDDIEIKIIRFAFVAKNPAFDYSRIMTNGVPDLNDLKTYDGFIYLPIGKETSISMRNRATDAGVYRENQFSFTVEKQTNEDYLILDKFIYKPGILFLESTNYIYMISSYDEPILYIYEDDIKKIDITFSGTTRRKVLRKKRSPF